MHVVHTQTATHATLLARLSQPPGEGADAAWSEFVDRYGDLIRGFCRARGLSAPDADDVLQDVLLGLHKAMPGFAYDPSKGKFRGYLKAATIHALARKFGQNGRADVLSNVDAASAAHTHDAMSEEKWEQQWRRYHLRTAMRTIHGEFSTRDVQAFERYAVAGEPAQGVARDLDVSMDALYQIKTRIARRLAQVIEAQVADEG